MPDPRDLQDYRVLLGLKEKWDKEFMDRKDERESQVQLDLLALAALSPRRDKEKSFSLSD